MMNEDNYMICREYEEQFHPEKNREGFLPFFHTNTQKFYFAWYHPDGSVIMRSEGYSTESVRDEGMESVWELSESDDNFEVIEAKGIFYLILKAGNGKEMARSCPKKSVEEAWALIKKLSKTSHETISHSVTGDKMIPVDLKKDDHIKLKSEDTLQENASANHGDKEGLKWLFLIIPLLLLMLFFLLRSCDTCYQPCQAKVSMSSVDWSTQKMSDSIGILTQREWAKKQGGLCAIHIVRSQ